MSKRHIESTPDENPRKKRKVSADEVLVEAAGHTETVHYLVGLKDVDVDHTDIDGQTALHAAQRGHVDVVKKLVEAGAGVRTMDTEGRTCLLLAAGRGHTEVVRYLVGLPGVEIDHTDDEDWTALHLAADMNHTDAMQVLIDAGADIEVGSTSGNSPLHWACSSGSLDAVKLLVRAGAGVGVANSVGGTVLDVAASRGHTETVRYLVGLPEVEIDHTDGEGCTALHSAAGMIDAGAMQVLIDAGADVEAGGTSGKSPLFRALRSLDALKLLVRAGARVGATNNNGDTCLTVAARDGHTETVRYLVGLPEVDAGAGVGATNNNGDTCLTVAARYGRTETVRYLVGLPGVDVNHADTNGYTALHHAVWQGGGMLRGQRDVGVLQVLLEHGVDTSLRNRNGNTALNLAEISGCRDCLRHLS